MALLLFCLGYYCVLRRLTFYSLNRVYLVAAIVFSSVYPVVHLDGFFRQHEKAVIHVKSVVMSFKEPTINLIRPVVQEAQRWHWTEGLFYFGVGAFALRLLLQFLSLYRLYRESVPGELCGQPVRIIKKDISPFSFLQNIYINPAKISNENLQNVIKHEQIHVRQWHTIDILLAETSTVLYWFNPGIWLIKRAMRENIEFIADQKVLQKGIDSKAYQYSLLNVSVNASNSLNITSSFNFLTLKKRIVMMNAKKSSRFTLTRYVLLVPILSLVLLCFTLSAPVVIKNAVKAINNLDIPKQIISLDFNRTDADAQKKPITTVALASDVSDHAATSKVHFSLDSRDSSNYVLEGESVPKENIGLLHSEDIGDIYVLTSEEAGKLAYHFDSTNPVVFIFKAKQTVVSALKNKLQEITKSRPSGDHILLNRNNNIRENQINEKPAIFFSHNKEATEDSTNVTFNLIGKDSTVTKLAKVFGYGNAEFTYKGFKVQAELIEYDKDSGKGLASGNVIVTKKTELGDIALKGSKFAFSLNDMK